MRRQRTQQQVPEEQDESAGRDKEQDHLRPKDALAVAGWDAAPNGESGEEQCAGDGGDDPAEARLRIVDLCGHGGCQPFYFKSSMLSLDYHILRGRGLVGDELAQESFGFVEAVIFPEVFGQPSHAVNVAQ